MLRQTGSQPAGFLSEKRISDGDIRQAVRLQNHRTHALCALMGGLRLQSADTLQFLSQLSRIFFQQFRHR